jgi:hypothetical protein
MVWFGMVMEGIGGALDLAQRSVWCGVLVQSCLPALSGLLTGAEMLSRFIL